MARGDDQQQPPDGPAEVAHNLLRSARFWSRASSIYLSYKATQLRALAAAAAGWDAGRRQAEIWDPQHEYAGRKMYELCVDLRGFYLKVGGRRGGGGGGGAGAWLE